MAADYAQALFSGVELFRCDWVSMF